MAISFPSKWPLALLPLISALLNLGISLGGICTAIPFYSPGISGFATALFFLRFFFPRFILVTSTGIITVFVLGED
ncbi:hypothetical protein LSUE1_G004971 [Lachnellula suecica]|uniref:Uncharacterized protein n=1 Tax=Lachnellula suecica TaxID=602035 RepID=A0A8T9CB30_9HELO|nr:hypothetical protein LSUE1_G004971 [Lachnellula suecica]